MPNFIVVNRNAQANGDHEVHNTTTGCGHMPDAANRMSLGSHATCRGAVQEAKRTYARSNGCYYCCNECNTG